MAIDPTPPAPPMTSKLFFSVLETRNRSKRASYAVSENDILVRLVATSINPADAKNRALSASEKPHQQPLILGYDAVGIIESIGKNVTGFAIGDKVYYAGDVTRAGAWAAIR